MADLYKRLVIGTKRCRSYTRLLKVMLLPSFSPISMRHLSWYPVRSKLQNESECYSSKRLNLSAIVVPTLGSIWLGRLKNTQLHWSPNLSHGYRRKSIAKAILIIILWTEYILPLNLQSRSWMKYQDAPSLKIRGRIWMINSRIPGDILCCTHNADVSRYFFFRWTNFSMKWMINGMNLLSQGVSFSV